ncbi:MAG: RNA-binding S4 domain-containing protein, partial [Zoogloeaceae bacterium]|nr:RNA-binding S4 domain-containing protein [Zoogloeaceae bacterium]
HAAVETGQVTVDGRIESRKRAKLRAGQSVVFGQTKICLEEPPAE